ncbi:MAG: hypothetical protein LBF15_02765 [Candidatus Peribacteria bacterium]|jgi:hypothetical protein|nr:hypothetical protein [Candidatus Peribacteria bacterium]
MKQKLQPSPLTPLPKGEGKQKFSKKVQKKFLDYFKAKDKLSKIEKEYFEKTYKYVKLIK